jgi:hypothetical protein
MLLAKEKRVQGGGVIPVAGPARRLLDKRWLVAGLTLDNQLGRDGRVR